MEITCTAHYADGTSACAKIDVKGAVVSYEDVGMIKPEEDSGFPEWEMEKTVMPVFVLQ